MNRKTNIEHSTSNIEHRTRSRYFLRRWMFDVGCSMFAFLFCILTSSCNRAQPVAHEKTITVWYSWGNDLAKQLRVIADEFERTHPGVRVQLSYSANDLTSNQKL